MLKTLIGATNWFRLRSSRLLRKYLIITSMLIVNASNVFDTFFKSSNCLHEACRVLVSQDKAIKSKENHGLFTINRTDIVFESGVLHVPQHVVLQFKDLFETDGVISEEASVWVTKANKRWPTVVEQLEMLLKIDHTGSLEAGRLLGFFIPTADINSHDLDDPPDFGVCGADVFPLVQTSDSVKKGS